MEGYKIYGEHLPRMKEIKDEIDAQIQKLRAEIKEQQGMDPIEHCLSRIKTESSMREKCRRRGLEETTENALTEIKDAIGFRIVCAFVNDVYMVRNYLTELDFLTVIEEKDYIKKAKPNGYRSYHMILQTRDGYYIEVQLRTISMDTWAALEHHLKYKKNVIANEALIVSELKRCADELASTDVSMQIIKDMIFTE
jgi:ppGpp synthetase/RelA/SpoT-type nucleotidyltranferase